MLLAAHLIPFSYIRFFVLQLGTTKVFIKFPETVFKLEEERDAKLEEVAKIIQDAWRMFLIRREIAGYYEELKTKSVMLWAFVVCAHVPRVLQV